MEWRKVGSLSQVTERVETTWEFPQVRTYKSRCQWLQCAA